jgi:hypothetical protein
MSGGSVRLEAEALNQTASMPELDCVWFCAFGRFFHREDLFFYIADQLFQLLDGARVGGLAEYRAIAIQIAAELIRFRVRSEGHIRLLVYALPETTAPRHQVVRPE